MHFGECPFIRQDDRSSRIGTVRPETVRVLGKSVENGLCTGTGAYSSVSLSASEEELGGAQRARWINRCATSSFQSARSSILAARGFWLLYY